MQLKTNNSNFTKNSHSVNTNFTVHKSAAALDAVTRRVDKVMAEIDEVAQGKGYVKKNSTRGALMQEKRVGESNISNLTFVILFSLLLLLFINNFFSEALRLDRIKEWIMASKLRVSVAEAMFFVNGKSEPPTTMWLASFCCLSWTHYALFCCCRQLSSVIPVMR